MTLTDEWIETWEKSRDERPVSIFFRLAVIGDEACLPLGVNPGDPREVEAIAEIRAAMEEA